MNELTQKVQKIKHGFNDIEFEGNHQDFPTQLSKVQIEERILKPDVSPMRWNDFIIERYTEKV